MADAAVPETQRDIVAILAFAAREFDRARDLLVRDDEPGPETVADAESSRRRVRGPVGAALRTAGAVAGLAGRVLAGSTHPAARGWAQADLDDRIDWWVGRFGTAAAALAAVPGLGGKVGKIVGLDDIVGASAQALVVNAVAREMGVTDIGRRVTVAARIVLGHELDPAAVDAAVDSDAAKPASAVPGEAPEERTGPLGRLGRTAQLIWRVASRVRSVRSDLDERQKGGLFGQALSNLPGVGVIGLFATERTGIAKAADQARIAFSS